MTIAEIARVTSRTGARRRWANHEVETVTT